MVSGILGSGLKSPVLDHDLISEQVGVVHFVPRCEIVAHERLEQPVVHSDEQNQDLVKWLLGVAIFLPEFPLSMVTFDGTIFDLQAFLDPQILDLQKQFLI